MSEETNNEEVEIDTTHVEAKALPEIDHAANHHVYVGSIYGHPNWPALIIVDKQHYCHLLADGFGPRCPINTRFDWGEWVKMTDEQGLAVVSNHTSDRDDLRRVEEVSEQRHQALINMGGQLADAEQQIKNWRVRCAKLERVIVDEAIRRVNER